MAYQKKCNTCGQKISMRKMQHGSYVAFNAGTDVPHEHYKKNKPKVLSTKNKTNQKNQDVWSGDDDDVLEELYESGKNIDYLSGFFKVDEHFIINKLKNLSIKVKDESKKTFLEKESLNFDKKTNNHENIEKIIIEAINKSKILNFDYIKNNGAKSNRDVYPLKKHINNNGKYLEAYCTLRKENRIFSYKGIKKIKSLSKSKFTGNYKPYLEVFDGKLSNNISENKSKINNTNDGNVSKSSKSKTNKLNYSVNKKSELDILSEKLKNMKSSNNYSKNNSINMMVKSEKSFLTKFKWPIIVIIFLIIIYSLSN